MPSDAVQPADVVAWRRWLADNHTRSSGTWLILLKKHIPQRKLDATGAIEEAICFGWIDSKPRSLDGDRSMLWFAPRKRGSGWSRLNKQRVERLIAEGRMTSAGLKRVDEAKEDGSWNRLDKVEALEIPDDLKAAFRRHNGSQDHFDAFPRSTKRAILEWIEAAKKPETRSVRIEETAKLASKNKRANEWRSIDRPTKIKPPKHRGKK